MVKKGVTDGRTDGLNESYSCLVTAKNHLWQPDFQSGNLKFTIVFTCIWLDMQPLKTTEGHTIIIWWQGCPLGCKILHYVVEMDHVFVSGAVHGFACPSARSTETGNPMGASNHGSWHNKANLRDLLAATGLVILLKLDSNRRFFSPCDLEIWWMTSKNYKAPLLNYIKLCASS